MAKREEYIGKKFGDLTVADIYRNEKGYQMCSCVCNCGNITEVYLTNLKAGRTKSCGCGEEANRRKFTDITGRRFGKLVAVRPTKERSGGSVIWECRCDCGEICYKGMRNLVRGFSKHCGCQVRTVENPYYKDLSGQRFHRLVALYPTEKRSGSGSIIWHCRCDCGQEVDTTENSLVHGNQISCGCRRVEAGSELVNYLHFIDGTCVEYLSRKKRCDNTSGYTGVYRVHGKYRAQITFKGKRYYLGTFNTFEEAKAERDEAEARLFKPFIQQYAEGQRNTAEAVKQ